MFKTKITSLTTKIVISFIILGFFLLTILFVLIVPKMQKDQINYATNQVQHMILLTNLQLKLAVKFLIKHGQDRKEKIKDTISYELDKIAYNIKNTDDLKMIEKYVKQGASNLNCDIYLVDKNKNTIFKTSKIQSIEKVKHTLEFNKWISVSQNKEYSVCPTSSTIIYHTQKTSDINNSLIVSCNPKNIIRSSENFEEKIKKDIQKSFALTKDIHKGKTYLIWIDVNNALNKVEPLYNKTDNYYNEKYCISKISDLTYPRTGLLSGKELLEAADKGAIEHLLDSDLDKGNFIYPALTWVKSINNNQKRKLLFITTVYVKDFDNKIDSSFWNILPASLLALLLAITLGFFIFRRLFKSINILTNTVSEVNSGNINLRTNIKGDDDISILAMSFDNMLNTIEKNINELDKKVESKTKELKDSLFEKEILLKEIHHRVKNNLAMTINLIKIQKSKIEDSKTKNALTDIQERIFTMELLHRKLYESKDLSSISFKKYMNELIDDLNITYKDSKDITIIKDIDDIQMSIEYALPCGLVITECLLNAYKYAFKEDSGIINISFKMNDNIATLIISDDGVGLPSGIDINKSKTLGLRLISSIVKSQLLGSFEYVYKDGSSFHIIFKIES